MKFYQGFDIEATTSPLGFTYGEKTFGPKVEIRTLDSIRANLKDPECQGPEKVYAIAMDVGDIADKAAIGARNLLYGAVTYASGSLGTEPIRSQGHVHAISPSCGSSTPEVYEIWAGAAYIYMQEFVETNPGRCFAIYAQPGDVVIVPPGWGHATISANREKPLSFGAWCVRDFGFDYTKTRLHGGLAWFPIIADKKIIWRKNNSYTVDEIEVRPTRTYEDFGIKSGISIYEQFKENPDLFLFVAQPQLVKEKWEEFRP
ncbi:MAG: glucose-6-phosphate isomerase family protein [Culicoidibacterales bacterium]